MKKKLFIGIFILCFPVLVSAQYVLVPIAPPPIFTFNDLWHFSIQGSGQDSSSHFYVSLRVFDVNNQLKVKSNTAVFAINSTVNYYNLSTINLLQPFTTSYYDGGLLQSVISTGGTFPPGTYHIVYTLYGKFADGEFAPLYEDASQAIVEAMWPPMLLSPPDGDTIETIYPLLTWTPAFSSSYTGLITYTLNLVEIQPGQNAYQAIQSNPTYFTQNNIPATLLIYPGAAPLLDTAKQYAWQVHADAQGSSLGSSEVWRFAFRIPVIPEGERDSTVIPEFYFTLEDHYPEMIMEIRSKKIPFKYIDRYNQSSDLLKSFALYRDGYEEPFLTGNEYDSLLHIKDIFYTIHLENNESFVPGHYLLVLKNIKDRTFYLRVFYRNEE